MTTALVTGAAGFVGRHLCAHLLSLGWSVDAVDSIHPLTGAIDPNDGWPLFEPRDYREFRFVREDCRDFFKRSSAARYDYVFHLAAIIGGRLLLERQPLAIVEDLAIDADFWRWAQCARPGKAVIFSSSAVYPVKYQAENSHVLLKESMINFGGDIGMPDLTYGWSKLSCEYLAHMAYIRHGLKSVVYRPFSGYGEDQDMTYPFPSICQRVLDSDNGASVAVWGSGRQMRDFIHVDDCIEGVLTTMDRIDDAGALNLSQGVLLSFADLTRRAAEIAGKRLEVVPQPDKPEGVFARGGDREKQRRYGVRPTILLDQGIERALNFLAQKQRRDER